MNEREVRQMKETLHAAGSGIVRCDCVSLMMEVVVVVMAQHDCAISEREQTRAEPRPAHAETSALLFRLPLSNKLPIFITKWENSSYNELCFDV